MPRDRPEMIVWTHEQLRAFLAHVAGDRFNALWRLAATTGMRRGELLGPRWTDLDLDAGVLNVAQTRVKGGGTVGYGRPKTAKGRRAIALDEATVAMLKAHRKTQARERLAWGPGYRDEGLIFCREDGSPIDPDVLSQRFDRLVRDAGLPRIRLHDLRHTYATAALRAGVPIKVVSERLGHATPAITLAVYAHVLPGMDPEAAEQVAALVDGI
jgi:integrase